MKEDSTIQGGSPQVLFWLAWIVLWGIFSLVIVGYLHRDNNHGVRPNDYSLRTIDSAEFAELTPAQQAGWDNIRGSEAYARVIIKNPFVFSHVLAQLLPTLLFAIVALVSYLRWHGLPRPKGAAKPAPTVNRGVSTTS